MSASTKAGLTTRESKTGNSSSRANKTNFFPPTNSPIDQISFLQRTVGNREVERLLKSGAIQAKLTIGQSGDAYEREADRLSEQVMSMPQIQPNHTPERLQAKRVGLGGLGQTESTAHRPQSIALTRATARCSHAFSDGAALRPRL